MQFRSAVLGSSILAILLTAGAAQGLAGSNTVTSDDIVDGQVYSADIRNSTITTSDIGSGQIRGVDVHANTLGPAQINAHALVYKGPQTNVTIPNNGGSYLITADCTVGDIAIGGNISQFAGMKLEGSENNLYQGLGYEWQFVVSNSTAAGHNSSVSAVCLRENP